MSATHGCKTYLKVSNKQHCKACVRTSKMRTEIPTSPFPFPGLPSIAQRSFRQHVQIQMLCTDHHQLSNQPQGEADTPDAFRSSVFEGRGYTN